MIEPKRFSDHDYAAPFGRYQSGSEPGASNQVLIGREGQRAYFIELLLRMGRRGAYLVTGHRGVGKTSFVNYCLAEYKEEVVERFLRSSVGRVMFWDHIGVLLLAFGMIFVMLMASEFLEIVAFSTGWGKGDDPDVLFGLVIVPLALVCIYPLLYARRILVSIFAGIPEIFVTIMTLALAGAAFFSPPFGSPALSMSRMFVAIAVLFLWVQSVSFNRSPRQPLLDLLLLAPSLLLAFGWLIWGSELLPISFLDAPAETTLEYSGNLLWGLLLLGMGLLLRGLHLLWLRWGDESRLRSSTPVHWNVWPGLLLVLGSCLPSYQNRNQDDGIQPTATSAALTLLLALIPFLALHLLGQRGKEQREVPSFRPRPRLVLAAKALLAIVVALQLVHPVFDRLTPSQEASDRTNTLRPATALWDISSSSPKQNNPNRAVFYGRTEELYWVWGLLLCVALLFFMEYEWVLRPFIREREDNALDQASPAAWQDQVPGKHIDRGVFRKLAHITLPWSLYAKWLPVLTVGVNLGFEKLDHRRVVHAMLAGLRDQYHRAFTAWNSGLANLGRLFAFLLLMMLVTLAGDRWFAMPEAATSLSDGSYAEVCKLFQGRQQGPGAVNLICKLKWGDSVLHVLYFNLLETKLTDLYKERDRHLLFYVFPYSDEAWPANAKPPLLSKGIHFRVYHVALFTLLFFIGRWLLHRLPVFPYREILDRIDDTLDNLSARTSVTSTTGHWKPAQWLQGFFMDERVRQTEQDPVDPRTVEFVFLQLLRDLQGLSIHLPVGRSQFASLPTPEVNFILDELDKIGARVDPDEAEPSGGAQQVEIQNAERRRSMELHKLLADMKNLLSSAPARFIFVGGRNLHDEWLADQTARQPLLTNIFNAEIYLPSLLTDYERQRTRREDPKRIGKRILDQRADSPGSDRGERQLSGRIEIYLSNQYDRALSHFERSREKHWLPVFSLPLEQTEREAYLQETVGSSLYERLSLYNIKLEEKLSDIEKHELLRDFVQFLTYRSMGNPKKLKELVSTFVRPAGRVVSENQRWKEEFRECDHVVFFGDTDRFRLQFLARVYRHLIAHFEQGLVHRDDKLAASVLYLTDFLFKFHRRAFSWSNLERVDELVHIHRAPDLREILEALVAQWSERFLHPIRNGMYDFRFRSDVAREVAYISRQSAEEMAAFNFTLDESQMLKSAYEINITRLGESDGKELQDLVAGLGELHEFDQEYETARFYYRRAMSLLDKELEEVMGGGVLSMSSSMIEIIEGVQNGQKNARLFMTWGIARLRLMLQIGMTFEHSRNLERAEVEYQNARTLAQSLLIAMLDDKGREEAERIDILRIPGSKGDDRLHALKHLNILFQPMFAEIWVAEKLTGGVDTSTSLAEREVWKLRNLLPFVREAQLELSESGAEAKGSNFALIATELHNKIGDLYFFKGRQLRELDKPVEEWLREATSTGYQGYLLAAHYHYAVGLHELRRFIVHRRKSSKSKWSLPPSAGLTIVSEGWPDFVFRAVGGAFNDLAEALLGKISLMELLGELRSICPLDSGAIHIEQRIDRLARHVEKLAQGCTEWLETDGAIDKDGSAVKISILLDGSGPSLGTLNEWLGDWDWAKDQARLLSFRGSPKSSYATFLVSIAFSLVGARYLKIGGYIEDAARELLKVCETISNLLWWGLTTEKIMKRPGSGLIGLPRLFELGIHALSEAAYLFARSRQSESFSDSGTNRASLIGHTIPVFAMTMVYSLALALDRWEKNSQEHEFSRDAETKLKDLIDRWYLVKIDGEGESFRELLEKSVSRHSYPMLNRMHALKLLIDDAILGYNPEVDSEFKVKDKLNLWLAELLSLEASLDAPMHFTPFHSGVTCAMATIMKIGDEGTRYSAKRRLLGSQEMYTMRRAFYENISDLYYLYDDFNDRQLHFNHAIQMAGAELASLLLALIEEGRGTAPARQERRLMSIVFMIPEPLRQFAGDRGEVRVEGAAGSVGEALSLLWASCPAVRDRLLTELGEVRPHVNIFVDRLNIRDAGGLSTPVSDGTKIYILPAVSGG